MLKAITAAVTLITALALSPQVSADPWGTHDGTTRYNMDRSHSGSYQSGNRYARFAMPRHETLKKDIHRRVKNDVLPLRRIFALGRDYKGYRVDAVIVKVRQNGHQKGRLKLMVNGQTVDRARVRGDGTVRLNLTGNNKIGSDLRSLQLKVQGKVFIKNIKVKLSRVNNRRHWGQGRRPQADRTSAEQRMFDQFARLIFNQINNPWNNR